MTTRTPDRDTPGPIPPASPDPAALLRNATAETLTRTAGPCSQQIRLRRTRTSINYITGELHRHHEVITARCDTRRAARCPSCSTLYKYDTYNLIAAGLRGGKNTPPAVSTHPRLFVTLTAPSFGPVHLGPAKSGHLRPCHPRRAGHGPDCRTWHRPADPLIGTPLDPDTYDYQGHVLFNATAGRLWSRFTVDLRRHLAEHAGIPRDNLGDHMTVSYAKVAEYQARGVIHYHAIIRLDGPDGPASTPPTPATASVLEDAIRSAAHSAAISTPAAPGIPARTLRFGTQTDIRPLTDTGERALTDTAVARYIAKYATKTTETTGAELPPLTCRTCHATGSITRDHGTGRSTSAFCPDCHGTGRRDTWAALLRPTISEHARRLVETCWHLGGMPHLSALRLRQWAHMLGFRGHVSTRSRTYSTTLTALRQERTAHQAALNAAAFGPDPQQEESESTLVINTWHYLGQHTTDPTARASPPAPTTSGAGVRR
ncbi:replication initiation protein [Actinocrinis puniceicyclus]|uniref:Replication initiation protein n=1 Tax=Actinocrinis puniceicyclus TaxID=977794 RepID=A0A8J7WUL3_9ACTN|nr:replication initiator [Actinocrinis puniceicyclus]MBS2966419.1 replication initiation protein [Actinocrinis puniceicyclus]